MATYKLIRLPDINGDGKVYYDLKCVDEWIFTLVDFDYDRLERIASLLEIGEEYIIEV